MLQGNVVGMEGGGIRGLSSGASIGRLHALGLKLGFVEFRFRLLPPVNGTYGVIGQGDRGPVTHGVLALGRRNRGYLGESWEGVRWTMIMMLSLRSYGKRIHTRASMMPLVMIM